ncbi:PKD domain-containing protein, partial [bacterium]|nr:PKD domain-containing protein [bacterium]
ITMIAQNYLAKTNDGIGDDALEAWIDGDKSGEVGISDITPIAQGYLNTVMEYRILTSSQPDSGFTVIGSPIPFGDAGVFPKTFSVILPVEVQQYVAVAPVDVDGNPGERSGAIQVAGFQDPEILGVSGNGYSGSEIFCTPGSNFAMSALAWGTEPIAYSWDFGGGAAPLTSVQESPTITASSVGTYICSLSVANANGLDTFEFSLIIEPIPLIAGVSPLRCQAGSVVTFTSLTEGVDLSYSWDFEGGATPNTSHSVSPEVIIGQAGTYNATLSVSNTWGSFSKNFTLHVVNDLASLAWHCETINSAGDALYSSIAIDTDDKSHICYNSITTPGNASLGYAYGSGSSWSTKVIDLEGDRCSPKSLAIDALGIPSVTYYDLTNGKVKYARKDGDSWLVDVVDNTDGVGWYSSLEIDTLGRPHISYYDQTNQDLKYAVYSGTLWECESIDVDGEVGEYTSIALNSMGMAYISYWDRTNDDLKVAHYDGTLWIKETVDSVGCNSSIAFDSLDSPFISYYDYDNSDLKLAHNDGSSWIIDIIDSDCKIRDYTSMALDSSDMPHICYYEAIDKDLKYVFNNGLTWVIQTVDSDGDVGDGSSLALDSLDFPHISYIDSTNYRLKYAWFG